MKKKHGLGVAEATPNKKRLAEDGDEPPSSPAKTPSKKPRKVKDEEI